MKAKILSVRINRKVDTDPDLSYLGRYHSHTPRDHAIDRQERGEQGRGEHRYFEPAQHRNVDEWDGVSTEDVLKAYGKEIATGYNELSRDVMCEALNKHYAMQDYKRMEAYNRGVWCMVGIHASAQIASGNGIIQHLRSGGVWGIESDSSPEHFAEIEQQELEGLRAELEGFGFGRRQIDHAFKNVERGQE